MWHSLCYILLFWYFSYVVRLMVNEKVYEIKRRFVVVAFLCAPCAMENLVRLRIGVLIYDLCKIRDQLYKLKLHDILCLTLILHSCAHLFNIFLSLFFFGRMHSVPFWKGMHDIPACSAVGLTLGMECGLRQNHNTDTQLLSWHKLLPNFRLLMLKIYGWNESVYKTVYYLVCSLM